MFSNDNPGPGTYFKENPWLGQKVKTYSFAGKARPVRDPITPGPEEYDRMRSSLGFAPAWSMTSKPPKFAHDSTPGPGKYFPEQVHALGTPRGGGPLYSMRPRPPLPRYNDEGEPGPAKYQPLEAFIKTKRRAPAFICGERTHNKEPDDVPGPAKYHADALMTRLSTLGGAKWTFRGKYRNKVDVDTRPPQYSLKMQPSGAPSFSMALKLSNTTSTFWHSGNSPILALGPRRRQLVREARERSRTLALGSVRRPLPPTPRIV